jgi:SAM-dependent methyltransferase
MTELRSTLEHYYYKPALGLFRAIELRAIREAVGSFDSPLLDLGCGDGSFMSLLSDQPVAAGIDISEKALEKARRSGVYKEVRLAGAGDLPFADASFETVFSNCVLEHIAGIDEALAEVRRVLRPGGGLVFTVPSQYFDEFLFFYRFFKKIGLSGRAKRYPVKLDKRINQIHKERPQWWREKLSRAGLTMSACHYYLPRPALGLWDILNVQPLRVVSFSRFSPRPMIKLLVGLENSLLRKPVAQWSRPLDDHGAGLLILASKPR